MDPLTIALMGTGVLGGIFGGQGRKPIDAGALQRLFGPQAIAGETNQLYQLLASSPQFQAMMNSASAQGTGAGQRLRANLASAGLGTSGVGALQNAVSHGFGNTMMLNARGGLWGDALSAAMKNISDRMGVWSQSQLQQQQTPTMLQALGAGLTGAASTGLTALAARGGKAAASNPLSGWDDALSAGPTLNMPGFNSIRPLGPTADTYVRSAAMQPRVAAR